MTSNYPITIPVARTRSGHVAVVDAGHKGSPIRYWHPEQVAMLRSALLAIARDYPGTGAAEAAREALRQTAR